ncbi:MAG: quinolinate synthase NadA [Deltaproteobacteria bacterium]|jgi:quinolinate synthase|nr:quinolinate synthase NadA [Deltaproteobacteria bacterium]
MTQAIKLGPRRAAQAKRLSELAQAMGVDILAHFYQRPEVKSLASHVGGSLGLYQAALRSQAKAIMVCGVDFLAQAIERLRPDLEILVPRVDADCPFSRSVSPMEVAAIREKWPGSLLVADIKASGEVRDLCDLEVGPKGQLPMGRTGMGPVHVLPALSAGDPGKFPHCQWPAAACQVHLQVTAQEVGKALGQVPGAKLAANSLCRPEVRLIADFVGDSQSIFDYCLASPQGDFLVACESGLVESLRLAKPQSRFFETETEIFCPNMKLTNIKDMLYCLEASLCPQAADEGHDPLAGEAR